MTNEENIVLFYFIFFTFRVKNCFSQGSTSYFVIYDTSSTVYFYLFRILIKPSIKYHQRHQQIFGWPIRTFTHDTSLLEIHAFGVIERPISLVHKSVCLCVSHWGCLPVNPLNANRETDRRREIVLIYPAKQQEAETAKSIISVYLLCSNITHKYILKFLWFFKLGSVLKPTNLQTAGQWDPAQWCAALA